ncbi:KAP family P-loop NTPase fold protein [Aquirufa nivalisilvae]
MEDFFSADKPIKYEIDDKFQRYNFSKRIAETIVNRTNSDSIVIGLYGAWGEGKTSVLNFIKHELNTNHQSVIHFTFNPWRFTDEAALLTSFFNTLANELMESLIHNKKIDNNSNKFKSWFNKKKGHLKTNTETIGDIIQEYGKIVSFFGAGESAQAIGKAISNVDVEKLKARIESLLLGNRKRVVIFIDDIDRLEKNEIHSIFRLVKLTGDFAFTTYLLSFDENMVSSAIGERFGTGDQKAGLSFLEKIIQIPIKLPVAQKVALKNYCLKLIDQSLDSSGVVLTEEESREYVRKFTSNFLIRLNTPRLAVRYGNTLSFSLPLLKGEVNYVDLLLIEAIRVFFPEIYHFVRNQPDYFIGSYSDDIISSNSTSQEKIEKFKKIFEECTSCYTPDEKVNVKSALSDLFPNLDKVWGRSWRWGTGTQESRYNQKRISANQYFNRYFSYTVIKGDISDVAFSKLLETIKLGDYKENVESTKYLIQSATPENFIDKIRYKEKTFDSETSIAIVKVLSQLGDCFSDQRNSFHIFQSTNSEVATFLAQLIRNQVDDSEKFRILQWVIENAIPFEFANEIFINCYNEKGEFEKLFTDMQYKNLARKLIKRAKVLANDKPIWVTFIHQSKIMLDIWAIDLDKRDLTKYVKNHLDTNPQFVIPLLKVFVRFIYSSAHKYPYYGEFDNESYNRIIKIVDSKYIFSKVEEVLGIDLRTIENYENLEHNQTDENLMKQFAFWHIKNTNNTKNLQ